jgi:hypothetical protein
MARRQYTRNGVACQVFFARLVQIVYNCGSLRNGVVNQRKFGEIEQKVLDITTPRAAPRNSLAFFSRLGAKTFDNGCNCLYNYEINRRDTMTENQFELLLMHGGMMQDGLTSVEALALVKIVIQDDIAKGTAEANWDDFAWLVKRISK